MVQDLPTITVVPISNALLRSAVKQCSASKVFFITWTWQIS